MSEFRPPKFQRAVKMPGDLMATDARVYDNTLWAVKATPLQLAGELALLETHESLVKQQLAYQEEKYRRDVQALRGSVSGDNATQRDANVAAQLESFKYAKARGNITDLESDLNAIRTDHSFLRRVLQAKTQEALMVRVADETT